MLSKVKTLKGYSIQGTEGEKIGTVKDFCVFWNSSG